jgi:hypothetical protein
MHRHHFDLFTWLKRQGLFVCMFALSVGGCANEGVVESPPSSSSKAAIPPSEQVAENTLARASYFYDEGNYSAVIGLLTANRDWLDASVSAQTRARKLLAFSHCLGGQTTLCEWYFEAILERDPGFDLTPYEMGHPAWDPAFRRAKRAVSKKKGG